MGEKNSLIRFLAGLALMVVGLFLLFNRVHVGSGFGWGVMHFGFFSVPSGLVFVPFIIGVVWMFGSNGSLPSKIFTAFTVLIILAAIIMNTSFWVDRMTMFDWLLMLVMIFGGGGIVASVLFASNDIDEKQARAEAEKYKKMAEEESKKSEDLEKELKTIKDNMNKNA
jgi:hypothetical protein